GVWEALRRAGKDGRTADQLAKECNVEAHLLKGVLQYIAHADTVLVKEGELYRPGATFEWLFDESLRQTFLTILGGNHALMTELTPALRREKKFGKDFFRRQDLVAWASYGVTKANYPFVVSELKRLGAKKVA